MPRNGAYTLGEFAIPTIVIKCEPCGRREQHARADLWRRFGDIGLPSMKEKLVACQYHGRHDISCKAHYVGLFDLESRRGAGQTSIELPTDLHHDGRLVVDTIGRAYVTDHALKVICPACDRSSFIDLLALIEKRGHQRPIAGITGRCNACNISRIVPKVQRLRRPAETGDLPYPGPPIAGQEEAWEAEYAAYRQRREAR